jgi:molybdate transport system ATP-binding protein
VIEIFVRHRLGELTIEADLYAEGRLLALCGVSGAGKTSLLNMIAGLMRPDSGRIAIGGVTFFDSDHRIDLAPQARRVGYVFQEPRLFPHLTAAGNLRYGARFAGGGPRPVKFDDVVELLGVGPLLHRRPGKLSGGEKQRIAIGRALLMAPRALLLDEPLAAIDDARRQEILALIEKLRDAFMIPMVFVSHRVSEVERLADEIADVEAGKALAVRRAPPRRVK